MQPKPASQSEEIKIFVQDPFRSIRSDPDPNNLSHTFFSSHHAILFRIRCNDFAPDLKQDNVPSEDLVGKELGQGESSVHDPVRQPADRDQGEE